MSEPGADFGLVGLAYEAPMALQDAQSLINWYPEVSEGKESKMPVALLGCPGLNPITTLPNNQGLQVRGAWVLPGGNACLWVVGNTINFMKVTVPATQTSIAQFSVSQLPLGTLLTNSGPVSIRDNGGEVNGQGGFALIVDGQYAYFYTLGGANTFTFTGGITNGSTTITLPGALPNGLLMSPGVTLSDGGSNIPNGTYIASINYSAPSITMSAPATGTVGSDTITVSVPVFGQITDPGFVGADRLAFIEGWLILNDPGTRTFQTTGPTPYTLLFPASFNALKDSSTDNLVTLFENNRELWLIGERTSEVWYPSGGQNFGFARIPGIGPQIGCSAKHSIARMGHSLVWLAKNEQGENMVVATQQYGWERVSTHAVEHAISSYPQITDAIGYAYEEEGHLFYVLTFPTADVTWCFDATASRNMGKMVWHKRLSFDPNLGVYHRHRSNCFVDFANVRMVGDYQSGQVHQMSRQFYTDAGAPLRCQRRTPHVWSHENRERIFQSSLQIEFTPGVGLQTGQGSNPQCMLRWSNDGSSTWSNEHWLPIGAAGATRNRAKINRLGRARDRVYELNYSDPTARDIIGATLYGEAEAG